MARGEFGSAKVLDRGIDNHLASHRFMGYSRADWLRWRADLLTALRSVFGPLPGPGPAPHWETVDTVEFPTYLRHKITYESRLGEPVPAYLLVPHERKNAPGAAALCVHGHVPGGKESVVTPSDTFGQPYGAILAEQGCVTLCPDNAGMGERDGGGGCELLWRRLNYLGQDITGYRAHDLVRAVDLLASLPEVDAQRIGSVGLSGGCWLAMVHAAFDDRVRATVLSGYVTTFAQTSWRGHCLCHHPKGIGAICEMPDIVGLIAPRPVCVEWGTDDTTRPVSPAFQMAQAIYRAAGAGDAIELAVFNGGHRFDGTKSLPWLVERLSGGICERETA